MKLQAREILRAAKRHGIKLTPRSFRRCAVAVIGKEVCGLALFLPYEISKEMGINEYILWAIERGFEGTSCSYPDLVKNELIDAKTYQRYRRVGERVREAIK